GTPGTGKSAVARRLPASLPAVEVGDWAADHGLGRRSAGGVEVDLATLRRRFWSLHRQDPYAVYVGHLAHLLPIPDVLLLRCHPLEIARRLAAAGRGSASDRVENVAAEALDVILCETLDLGRRVWEVDTTERTADAVARAVARRAVLRGPPRFGRSRWLVDPDVTAYLLERAP
ncbi:adenylate kinase, partial [mine drainage metagenome]